MEPALPSLSELSCALVSVAPWLVEDAELVEELRRRSASEDDLSLEDALALARGETPRGVCGRPKRAEGARIGHVGARKGEESRQIRAKWLRK